MSEADFLVKEQGAEAERHCRFARLLGVPNEDRGRLDWFVRPG